MTSLTYTLPQTNTHRPTHTEGARQVNCSHNFHSEKRCVPGLWYDGVPLGSTGKTGREACSSLKPQFCPLGVSSLSVTRLGPRGGRQWEVCPPRRQAAFAAHFLPRAVWAFKGCHVFRISIGSCRPDSFFSDNRIFSKT